MIVNKGERTYGKKASQDVWLRKLRCACGSTYRKNKWRTNKRGDEVFGYQCYNQVNNGSKTFREKNGLDIEGYCDIPMIGDWKLDLMAKKIFESLWTDKKAFVLEAYRILNECYKSNSQSNQIVILTLKGKIERVNAKINNLINMRSDGEISKDEFKVMRDKATKELETFNSEFEKLSAVTPDEISSLNLGEIENALNILIDFSGTKIDDNIIDKFVSRITPIDNMHYRWDLNFSLKEKQAIIGCVEGRKNSGVVFIKKRR